MLSVAAAIPIRTGVIGGVCDLRHADGVALATALLFCVHPMAAEVVLYATQRTEAIVSQYRVRAVH